MTRENQGMANRSIKKGNRSKNKYSYDNMIKLSFKKVTPRMGQNAT